MANEILDHQLEEFYNTAVELARKAGEAIKDSFYKEKHVDIKMSAADLVTETDHAVEKMVQEIISQKYPTHKFIGEETISADGSTCILTDDPTWIVDPIDGTTNFVHSIPEVSFSCGILVNKEIVIGVVYVPVLDQMYTAKKGQGAFLNGQKLSVSKVTVYDLVTLVCAQYGCQAPYCQTVKKEKMEKCLFNGDKHCLFCNTELKQSVIIVEGGSSRNTDILNTKIENIHNVVKACHGIRAYGSAAINLCKIASGITEGYVEYGIHCWDIVAGMLILQEAGGVVRDTTGEEVDIMRRRITGASCENIIKQLAIILTHLDMGRD